MKNAGPLPPGRYYIVDRGSGGLFSHVRDIVLDTLNHTQRSNALYRDDGNIDDWTFVNDVARSHFRLHPHGMANNSGITLTDPVAFETLREHLLVTTRVHIPGGKGFAYGIVDVN